ncbi:MAG TPA: chromate resistance protein ChrB domain-containing protein, partial [Casimicrobiaceae bacterium]|nr:chromate resistance protein ChrB domain-containing protein [Casimicrobiaceae bacterium]
MENEAVPSISVAALRDALSGSHPPIVIDVRREEAFAESTQMVAGALRRSPASVADWAATLPVADTFVVYCMHGQEVGQRVAGTLLECGLRARYLAGGLAAWGSAQAPIDAKPRGVATRWVTRERPKIDRIACPWLIARFVDADAQFLYVPASQVLATAADRDAIPYDISDVHFSHDGERCSFDAFLAHYRLRDPALAQLARIVRGADTAHLELTAQSAGLAAISLGLSRNFADDHEMLAHGMVIYDALYRWCREGQDEVHTWNPQAYEARAAEAVA